MIRNGHSILTFFVEKTTINEKINEWTTIDVKSSLFTNKIMFSREKYPITYDFPMAFPGKLIFYFYRFSKCATTLKRQENDGWRRRTVMMSVNISESGSQSKLAMKIMTWSSPILWSSLKLCKSACMLYASLWRGRRQSVKKARSVDL